MNHETHNFFYCIFFSSSKFPIFSLHVFLSVSVDPRQLVRFCAVALFEFEIFVIAGWCLFENPINLYFCVKICTLH
jgi:hypothetical protein